MPARTEHISRFEPLSTSMAGFYKVLGTEIPDEVEQPAGTFMFVISPFATYSLGLDPSARKSESPEYCAAITERERRFLG